MKEVFSTEKNPKTPKNHLVDYDYRSGREWIKPGEAAANLHKCYYGWLSKFNHAGEETPGCLSNQNLTGPHSSGWSEPLLLHLGWRTTEPRNHQGWKRPPGSSRSNMSAAPLSPALNLVPKCHLCTSSLPMHRTKNIPGAAQQQDSVKSAKLKRHSDFPRKNISFLLLSAF